MAQDIAKLQVSLNLDTSQFKVDIATATRDVKELKSALSGLRSRTFKIDLSTNIKTQMTAFKSAGKTINELQQKLRSLEKSLRGTTGHKTLNLNVNTNADKVAKDVTTMYQNTKTLKPALSGLTTVTNTYSNALKGLKISCVGVNQDLKKLITTANSLKETLSGVDSQLTRIGTRTINMKVDSNVPKVANDAQQSMYRMTKTFTDSTGTIKKTFTGVGKTVEEATKKVDSMAQSSGLLKQQSSRLQSVFKDSSGKISSSMNEATKSVKSTTNEVSKLNNALLNVKSVAQGIIIAQGFYKAVNVIQEMAGSMWDMHKATETTLMAFEQLVGSADAAESMVTWLQQYAASTTFTFEQASQSAKTLLAYGFELKNLGYVMTTIGDTTSAFGKPENFDRIALALGQMLGKGTVKAEELRQLMEANVPVIEILSEKLGMTKSEIINIGDYAVDSGKAVNALLEGLNERYGGMSENMAQTTTGLLNNIRESIAYVGSQLFKPLYDSFSGILKPIAEKLNELSNVIRNAGIDGAIKYLFPPDMYNSVKVFIGLIGQLGNSIMQLLQSTAPLRQALLYTFINVFNAAAPVIIGFLNVLTKLMQIVAGNRIVLQALITTFIGFTIVSTVTRMIRDFRIGLGLLTGVVNGAKNAILLLRGAMTLLMTHPIVAGIAAISAAFIGLIMSTEKGREAVDKLWISLARLMGIKNVDIYEPLDPSDIKNQTDDFFDSINNSVIDTGDNIEDVGDESEKSGKKVKDKFVAAFDELFQVPDKLDEISNSIGNVGNSAGDGLGSGLDDLFDKDKTTIDTGAFDIEPIVIPIAFGKMPDPPKPPTLPPTTLWKPFEIEWPSEYPISVQSPNLPATEVWKPFEIDIPKQYPIEIETPVFPAPEIWYPFEIELPVDYPLEVQIPAIPATVPWKPIEIEKPNYQPIITMFSEISSAVKNWANEINVSISTILTNACSIGVQNLYDFASKGKQYITELDTTINNKITAVATSISTILTNACSIGVQNLYDFASKGKQYITELDTTINNKITSAVTSINTGFINGCQSAIEGLSQFKTNVSEKFNTLASDIKIAADTGVKNYNNSWASGFLDNLKNAGNFFVELNGGFSNAWSKLAQGVGNFFNGSFNPATITGFAQNLTTVDEFTAARLSKLAKNGDDLVTATTNTYSNIQNAAGMGMGIILDDMKAHHQLIAALEYENGEDRKLTQAEMWKVMSMTEKEMESEFLRLEEKFGMDRKDIISAGNKEIDTTFWNDWKKINEDVGYWGIQIGNNIKSKWEDLKKATIEKFTDVKKTISDKLSEAYTSASKWAGDIKTSAQSKWNDLKLTTQNTWNNIKTAIVSPIESAKKSVQSMLDWFGQKFDWLKDKISSMKTMVSNAVNSLNPFRSMSIDVPQLATTMSISADQGVVPYARTPFTNMPLMTATAPATRDTLLRNTTRQSSLNDDLNIISNYSKGSNSSSNLVTSTGHSSQTGSMSSGIDDRPILYVGTLIADDRSLKELERKMEVIRTKESSRRGR